MAFVIREWDFIAMARQPAEVQFAAQSLKASTVLRDIDEDDRLELARCAKAIAVEPGKMVAAPGLGARQIIIIHEGVAAALQKLQPGGRAALTALYGRGDICDLPAAFWLLDNHKETIGADARATPLQSLTALTNVSAHALAAADFMRVVRRNHTLMSALVEDMAHRLDSARRLIARTVFRPLEIRLAAFFSKIVDLTSPDDWNPMAPVGHISQSLIAGMLGVSREHINRTLTMWERSGLIFQARNGALTIQNRKRLSALAAHDREHTEIAPGDDWIWEIDAHLDFGLNQIAYHIAMEAVRRTPKDIRMRHRAVLAAARSGGPQKALEEFDNLDLDKEYSNEDVACLRPRLLRDLAYLARQDAPEKTLLKQSAQGYDDAFEHCGGYYSGVNAAAGYALLGEAGKARSIAKAVKVRINARIAAHEEDAGGYFIKASLAECTFISGDIKSALPLFQSACAAGDVTAGKKATTRKQLKRLAAFANIDDAWIDRAAPQAKVLFFSGPLAQARADQSAQLSGLKNKFISFLKSNDIGQAYGALASGADIVIAEILIAAGIDVNVYLPLAPKQFLKNSVRISGGDWSERFLYCMRRAATIEWNAHAIAPSLAAFSLGAQAAMGKAISHADQLESEAIGFFAAPANRNAENSLSVANLEAWRKRGLPLTEFRDEWTKGVAPGVEEDEEQILYALVLENIRGGKTAPPDFEHMTGRVNDVKGGLRISLFGAVDQAISAARTIANAAGASGWRIWLDAGVATLSIRENGGFEDLRDIFVTTKCMPASEPGQILASDLFVGAAHAGDAADARFEYIGFATTREKLEPCPLYLLAL